MSHTSPILSAVQDSRVIIILGSGGVGKTTTAVALATLGAKLGKKVGLLSIDPAKRLADAMGIRLSHELSRVDFGSHEVKGELWATMLDQKAVFDEMVRRFAPSPKIEALILNNGIYRAASSKLGGPLEYMALAKLQQMAEDSSFDLIILDTPPDTHALDFLVRPNILAGFMENKVMSWLIKPFLLANKLGRGRFISISEKIAAGISSITGTSMLRKLAEFLVLMEDIIQGFHHSGKNVAILLRQESTQFILVTAPTGASTRSAAQIAERLHLEKFPLRLLIVNRYLAEIMLQGLKLQKENQIDVGGFTNGFHWLERSTKLADEYLNRLKLENQKRFKDLIDVRIEEQSHLIHSVEAIVGLAELYSEVKKV